MLVPIARPALTKVHRYKDVHRGESCYLMGDGVSLKWFDLAAFTDKTTIPCAYTPLHKDFSQLHVDYMLLIEPWWFFPCVRTTNTPIRIIRNEVQKLYRKEAILRYPDVEFFVNLSNFPILRQPNITYLYRDIYDDRLPKDFITRRIDSFAGSLRASVMMAIYMGFDHCFLVGMDYTHVPSRSKHWYEKGRGVLLPQPGHNREFFEIAKEYIDITTITIDGASDCIDSVTYKDHTGRDPEFRENTELLDERYLNVLASWPGYKIF